MSKGSKLMLALIAAGGVACASDPAAPSGKKLTGFLVGAVGDSTPAAVPVGTGPMQVGGTVKGVGAGRDTMTTAVKIANVEIRAFKHLGYSGSDALVGEMVGSLTTDANGWYGYLSLPPGKYAITFTPPASSEYRAVFVTYESLGSPPGNTVASLWTVFLPRK